MRLLKYRVVTELGEMDFEFVKPNGTTIIMEARYDATDCLKIKVPHSVFKPAAIAKTVNVNLRHDDRGPFRHDVPYGHIFTTLSKMLPGQLEEQIAEAAIFSKRELDAEKAAKRCQEALGYMSAAEMVTTVGTGALFNFPVNMNLLRTALWKRAEVLKGKSKMKPSTIARVENTPVPDPAKPAISVSLSADIVTTTWHTSWA